MIALPERDSPGYAYELTSGFRVKPKTLFIPIVLAYYTETPGSANGANHSNESRRICSRVSLLLIEEGSQLPFTW